MQMSLAEESQASIS